jgi:tRNA(Glu) U13 pseudouridine synthase TruD
MLAELLTSPSGHSQLPAIMLEIGDAVLPLSDTSHLPKGMTLPLPSVRCKGLNPATHQLIETALQAYDMTLLDMKVSFPRDRWFSKAQRPCVVLPEHLSAEVIPDEHAAGQSAVVLEFQLDRGCYATMLIKALTASGEADV